MFPEWYNKRMDGKGISIIIPFYNEEDNVEPVIAEVMEKIPGAEIVAVDDGSTDGTLGELRKFPSLRVHSFSKNLGQGVAIHTGIKSAANECCVIMDGDGQYDPAIIPELAAGLERAHLVCGWRRSRSDKKTVILASRFSNSLRRLVLGDNVRDTGGIKAIRRSAALAHLWPFEGMHRYIAPIFFRAGLAIEEIPVPHRPRKSGRTKYTNTDRAIRGIIDLVRVSYTTPR